MLYNHSNQLILCWFFFWKTIMVAAIVLLQLYYFREKNPSFELHTSLCRVGILTLYVKVYSLAWNIMITTIPTKFNFDAKNKNQLNTHNRHTRHVEFGKNKVRRTPRAHWFAYLDRISTNTDIGVVVTYQAEWHTAREFPAYFRNKTFYEKHTSPSPIQPIEAISSTNSVQEQLNALFTSITRNTNI